MEIFFIFVIGIVMGIFLTKIARKYDGRLVIDKEDYFVAITTKTEDLKKKKTITLRVITK